jgi:uncharacterized protein YijF (DUF1287 family)
MPKKQQGFYDTIEYIGPRPQKPKRQNFFGGWVILVIAGVIAFWFGRPLMPFLRAAQTGGSVEQANLLVAELQRSGEFGNMLAAAASEYSSRPVNYETAYYKIPYPGGDVPRTKGKAEDVIVRCYRQLGIDLQQRVHEDMAEHFRQYPQIFPGVSAPDKNMDHRRTLNLQRFFSRQGQELAPNRNLADYQPGDIVVWALVGKQSAEAHIGIVVPNPEGDKGRPWVVHHLDAKVKWEDALFGYQVLGHYRYPAPADLATIATAAATAARHGGSPAPADLSSWTEKAGSAAPAP